MYFVYRLNLTMTFYTIKFLKNLNRAMFPADIEDETKSRHGCLLSIILNRSKGMEE